MTARMTLDAATKRHTVNAYLTRLATALDAARVHGCSWRIARAWAEYATAYEHACRTFSRADAIRYFTR